MKKKYILKLNAREMNIVFRALEAYGNVLNISYCHNDFDNLDKLTDKFAIKESFKKIEDLDLTELEED